MITPQAIFVPALPAGWGWAADAGLLPLLFPLLGWYNDHMEMIYYDKDIAVCVKPSGVLSTDEEGGMPSLVRCALGGNAYTVHRLDRVVGGLMVLALRKSAATALSKQMMSRSFGKEYWAVVHGAPEQAEGTFTDLLLRDKSERKTYVVTQPGRDVREAVLDYRVLERKRDLSLVDIELRTGRTHQIRAQFSSRDLPLVGDKKYSTLDDDCPIALWSRRLEFCHPYTGERMEFECPPPEAYPWAEFGPQRG